MYRTIVRFKINGEVLKMTFPGAISEERALKFVQVDYPFVFELDWHYIKEL